MENSGSSNQQVSSPQSRRTGKTAVVSSPWNQIVRGESESNSVEPPSLSPPAVSSPPVVSDQVVGSGSSSSTTDDEISNGNAGKRQVWNVPSNGAVEVGPVMGAVSWPALSESARVSSKSSPADGSSSVPVSVYILFGSGTASSSPPKQVNSATPNSTPNNTAPVRQRSFKQRNAASSSDGSSPQPVHVGEAHLNNNPSPRDHGQRSSQSRSSSDHSGQQRNPFRSRNGGPHSRADGSYNHNYYGARRDQDRGNQEWNAHRNFNGRDGHMQPQRVSPRFMRHQPPPPPPPASTPFLTAPPVRPFGSPMPFAESLRGMPFVAAPMPPHAVFFPTPDFQLHSKIVTQIDYYFSNENLIRDTFLRQNMDEQGWVPIKLIAGFKKVSLLTDNVQLILDALRASIVVEVQGDKVRRRNDWMRWLMPQSVQFPSISSPRGIVANVQNMSLEEKIINQSSFMRSQVEAQSEAFPSRSSSGEISGHPQQSSSGEGTSQ
ncbi:La-related protein 1C [Linum perenne]